MRSVSVGRKPAITSSSSNSFGPVASARATSSRLRSGSVNDEARWPRLSKRSSRRSTSRACVTRVADVVAVQKRADDDIVLDRQRRERPHDLEGAADAAPADAIGRKPVDALAGERDAAAVRCVHAGDHVEQGRLAGAVRADDGVDAAFGHLEAEPIDRDEAAEALADIVDRQERAHDPRPFRPRRCASQGQTPSGSATITASRQTP